ncbi:MAG: hypothetical protein L3J65_02780 [Robiginitomaculum sp.]|nr:hypothetical protein [Robiginitomaculum sp.]
MTKTTTKTTKTAKKIEATKTSFVANLKTPAIVRKGFRAYVGVFGAAYEAAQPVFDKAVKNYDDYAARGEKLETVATTYAKDTRKSVTEFAKARFEKRSAQLRSFVPGAANDRVQELEAEISKLNKKIAGFAKKATKAVAPKASNKAA